MASGEVLNYQKTLPDFLQLTGVILEGESVFESLARLLEAGMYTELEELIFEKLKDPINREQSQILAALLQNIANARTFRSRGENPTYSYTQAIKCLKCFYMEASQS